ncbi:hypothetical protein [Cesiribacter sp. SM1]|uniref:hypothetical protein n=1 Tax=Cesiribacter sp. SM1 TaxID=2861196 RepID=UPI001CD6444E|nr:hypothetical protein [Cesiribacter sp. SM1]
MENNANNPKKGTEQKGTVEKVAEGRRASFGDEPLTPPKKMQAEESRMKNKDRKPEERRESDQQQAHLGSAVLTPQKKMEKAKQEAQSKPGTSGKGQD